VAPHEVLRLLSLLVVSALITPVTCLW